MGDIRMIIFISRPLLAAAFTATTAKTKEKVIKKEGKESIQIITASSSGTTPASATAVSEGENKTNNKKEKEEEGITATSEVDSTSTRTSNTDDFFQIITKTYPSDLTIRELWDELSISSLPMDNVEIHDATYHPPKDITSIFVTHDAITGTYSRTLFQMGWYPSGRLYIFASSSSFDGNSTKEEMERHKKIKDEILSGRRAYEIEEYAYNTPQKQTKEDKETKNTMRVKFTGEYDSVVTSKKQEEGETKGVSQELMPSQIFQSITKRFEQEEENNDDDEKKAATNQQKSLIPSTMKKKRKEEEEERRKKRLDLALQKLNDDSSKSKKNKKVTDQVRKMLIKSHALSGSHSKVLRMDDRFHLETVAIRDYDDDNGDKEGNIFIERSNGNTSELSSSSSQQTQQQQQPPQQTTMVATTTTTAEQSEYRYFSKMSTVGHVISSVLASHFNKTSTIDARKRNQITAELLVLRSVPKSAPLSTAYRRLPNTMTLFEAQRGGYLNEFDCVFVRIYPMRQSNAHGKDGIEEGKNEAVDSRFLSTPSILEEEEQEKEEGQGKDCNQEGEKDDEEKVTTMNWEGTGSDENNGTNCDAGNVPQRHVTVDSAGINAVTSATTHDLDVGNKRDQNDSSSTWEALCRRVNEAIHHTMEDHNDDNEKSGVPKTNKKKKKKKSSTSDKVRAMLMKSRAVGDKKRIKEGERFYLEAFVVTTLIGDKDGKSDSSVLKPLKCSSFDAFLSRRAEVSEILNAAVLNGHCVSEGITKGGSGTEVVVLSKQIDFLSRKEDCTGRHVMSRLDHNMTLHEAENKGHLCQFGQVVLLFGTK